MNAAVQLLANLGCVDVSRVEELGGDGRITPLGAAVAKLPLGVRYGKMLMVAAQADVLDYAIAMVAVLSESTPFARHTEAIDEDDGDAESERGKELCSCLGCTMKGAACDWSGAREQNTHRPDCLWLQELPTLSF